MSALPPQNSLDIEKHVSKDSQESGKGKGEMDLQGK